MQFKRNLKHIFLASLIVIILTLGIAFFDNSSATHFFVYRENVPFLNFIKKYHFSPSKDSIALIKISDSTLNYFQAQSDQKSLTIPKSVYIDLIEKLESVGVKGIAFDIIFQNKDPDEEKFRDIILKHKNVVIATELGEWKGKNGGAMDVSCSYDNSGGSCAGIPRSTYNDVPWGFVDIGKTLDNQEMFFNRKILGKSYNLTGSTNFYAPQKKEDIYYPLALQLYLSANPALSGTFFTGSSLLYAPFFGVPANTPGYGSGYQYFQLEELIKFPIFLTSLKGKYVIIGESGTNIHDEIRSPVSATLMPGMEYHANVLDGFIQGRTLKAYYLDDIPFLIGFILLIFLMSSIYLIFPRNLALSTFLLVFIGIIWFSRYLYFSQGIILQLLPLSLGVLPVQLIYRFFIVDREKNMISRAFAHYVDPEVVREIGEKAHTIELGGESRELSILFSDIAGFTTISEETPVRDLFLLMSAYLSKMTDILIAEGGTLDKYIGDAVMGFFGAPLPEVDHARRACQTAINMRKALPEFNAELVSRGLDPIEFRVGIGSGEVLVGNIGSHDRFNYTVLGDTVNLASRLEATSKEYGTHVIVSERTYELTKELFQFRRLDRITVKGKNESVWIYELIANTSDTQENISLYENYQKALDLYMRGDYLAAGQIWEAQMEDDPPSRTMALRSVSILHGEVVVEGGVYHMTKK